MEQTAKRLVLLGAMALVGVVAIPTFTTGQEYMPKSQAEYEYRELNDKINQAARQLATLDEVPLRLAVMQVQLNALAIGQQKTEDWQDKAFKGLLAMAGSFILVILGKFAGSIGVTFNRKQGP